MVVSLASHLVAHSKSYIYNLGLAVATTIGLPTTSWQAGDPSRALFHLESEVLSALEANVVGYIQSGFLDLATGVWLKKLAEQVYGVEVPEASYATTDVLLTNVGEGAYFFSGDIDPGDLTFKTASGVTFVNTTGGTMSSVPGSTLTLTVVSEVQGSAGSAGIGEISAFVTTILGVTVTNAAAAVGLDEQDESVTRQQCRDKLGMLSPNGAREAYSYVARAPSLGGTSAITRTRVFSSSTTGIVTIYLAGPSGGSSAADRALAEAAIIRWCTPLCITPVVLSATNLSIPVTYELWIYSSVSKTAAEVRTAVSSALTTMLATRAIGGDVIAPALTGAVYKSLIEATIKAAFTQIFRVSVSLPAGDTALTNGQVAILGATTGTVNFVVDPV